jgi:hypothetical protein
MDSTPHSFDAHAEPQPPSARKVDSPLARPTHPAAGKKPARRSQLFGFTIRLTPEQRSHFEALAAAQGHASVAAAFKTQALSYGMEHPLQEMRMSLEHMQERITEEGAWLQDRIQTVSHALDGMDRHVGELMGEMQTCTQAMLLFAQTNEALSTAVANFGAQRPTHATTAPPTKR